MTFSCTKKVLDKIGKYRTVENGKVDAGLYNWYVDSFILERKTWFLFTNSQTLFSFILYMGTKLELNKIENLFIDQLKEQIIGEISAAPGYFEKAGGNDLEFSFHKTNSRSVLGSMNDFKYQIKVLSIYQNEINNISHRLNECPMSALKYRRPGEVMKERLMQI